MGLVHALVVGDLAAVAGHQADALGTVVGGAAAQGENAVATVVVVELLTLHHVGVLGVGLGLAKDHGLHAGVLHDLLDAGGHGMVGQERIGDDHGLGAADALHQVAGLLYGAFAEHVSAGDEIIGRHTLCILSHAMLTAAARARARFGFDKGRRGSLPPPSCGWNDK